MEPSSTARLLSVWEDGLDLSPPERTRLLLGEASADRAGDDLGSLGLGEVDARLLRLRENLFGSRLEAVSRCPACAGMIEWELDLADLPTPAQPLPAVSGRSVTVDGQEIWFRAPSLTDLEAAGAAGTPDEGREILLRRCLLGAGPEGQGPVIIEKLSPAVIDAVAGALEEADPLPVLRFGVRCPVCDTAWSAGFDVARYLWEELDFWARGLLAEVHLLARSYGWGESEILALTPRRRRLYLEMITG